jgi:hypothetical protein
LIWSDIDGWLTNEGGDLLKECARARRILELGSWRGRSAVCMAETAMQVTTVDWGVGDISTGEGETFDALEANIQACGVASKVEPIRGKIADLAQELRGRRWDMVYIDASHDAESVKHDTELAADVVTPGGLIVWHDFEYPSVKAGIEASGLKLEWIEDHGTIGVLRTARWQVAVCMPWSRMVELDAYKSLKGASVRRFTDSVFEADLVCGGLTHNFNMLLDVGLELRDDGKLTHLAMIHSDISAERGWLDLLAEEMHMRNAVAISAVMPIKENEQDRTSTAIGSKAEPWEPLRYIRTRDKDIMPTTFEGKDVCQNDDEVLLINTGLMLIDLRCPFWDDFTFRVFNKRETVDGKRKSLFRSEDWEMSRELDAAGYRYASTWRPYAEHIGQSVWPNRPGLKLLTNSVGG